MRAVLYSVLQPGHEAAYERLHSRVPDDLLESFERYGIHDWTIWRVGINLLHLVECDDFEAAMRALGTDPANLSWQQTIGSHVRCFEPATPSGQPVPLGQVWRLSDQRPSGTAAVN